MDYSRDLAHFFQEKWRVVSNFPIVRKGDDVIAIISQIFGLNKLYLPVTTITETISKIESTN